jgi:hypothetical protein
MKNFIMTLFQIAMLLCLVGAWILYGWNSLRVTNILIVMLIFVCERKYVCNHKD